jgi:hypothetical protein
MAHSSSEKLKSRDSQMVFPPFWEIFQMTSSTIETDPNHPQKIVSSNDRCQNPTRLHLYIGCWVVLNF